jgi:hypothetical protein
MTVNSNSNDGQRDADYATTTLPPPLQLGIKVTAYLCIKAAHFRQSTNFANGPRICCTFHVIVSTKTCTELHELPVKFIKHPKFFPDSSE